MEIKFSHAFLLYIIIECVLTSQTFLSIQCVEPGAWNRHPPQMFLSVK